MTVTFDPLILNICSTSGVTWPKSVQNLNEIKIYDGMEQLWLGRVFSSLLSSSSSSSSSSLVVVVTGCLYQFVVCTLNVTYLRG